MSYDVVIVGAGPGGITLAINLKKLGYQVALIDKAMPGGKVNIAPRVDNYPGFKQISGPDLAMHFFLEMNNNGITYLSREVLEVKRNDNGFVIATNGGELTARAVVAASGTDEKKLDLAAEASLLGHGLSYCAICDGHFYKNQDVAVIAEDRYAIAEAIYLAGLASKVYVITSLSSLKGDKRLIDELSLFNNVNYIYNAKVTSLNGYPLESITLDNGEIINLKGIFPLLGYLPNNQYLPKEVLNEDGFLITNKEYMSNVDGLFGIGDILTRELKQIYIAVNDAKQATSHIDNYLKNH